MPYNPEPLRDGLVQKVNSLHAMQPAFINPAGYVVIKDLRGVFGVPLAESTIWQKVSRGEFPAPVKVCGVTAFRIGDVLDWLEAQGKTDPPAPAESRGQRLTAARLAKRQAGAASRGER